MGNLRRSALAAQDEFMQAAEAGHVEARYKLGQIYMGDFEDELSGGTAAGSPKATLPPLVRVCWR